MKVKQILAVMAVIIMICTILPTHGENAVWTCPECGKTGNIGNYCGKCQHPAPWIQTDDTKAIQDITDKEKAELEARVAELTKQVAELESASKTKDEAVTVATVNFGAQIKELNDKLTAAETAKAAAETQVTALTAQLANAEAKIAELTKQLEEAIAANNSNGKTRKRPIVGDIITIGHYEQDNNTANGKEEIEWMVLDVNEKDNKALLLSKYGLDAIPYNSGYSGVTWETCTLREWLNNYFYDTAFTHAEQETILMTIVDNSKSQGCSGWSDIGGNNTQDKIFLLSYAEANQYLGVKYGNRNNTASRVSPTAYAKQRGAYTSSNYNTADGDRAGWWWLRSPGPTRMIAARVSRDGSLLHYYVQNDSGCVRPALWVNLESGIF